MQKLNVYWNKEKVGTFGSDSGQASLFTYEAAWKSKTPISLSLPFREEPYGEEARNFFGNLLPEGDFRRRIEKRLKVSSDNDISLLEQIGGDCAGALSIATDIPDDEEAWYEELSAADLENMVRTQGLSILQTQGQIHRLSLAGAQGKIPLHREGARYQLPQKGAASSCIIKFNHLTGDFPHLVENEYFTTQAARYLGLNTITSRLQTIGDAVIQVSDRYDRTGGAWPQRLHQEDFCQALAFPYERKYQKEGGPDFASCIKLARRHLALTDINQLLDWFLVNIYLGNSDAHGKNISILYADRGLRLAPFYDLVCTRAYDSLDRKMAMACADEYDPDLLSLSHIEGLAKETGVTQRFLIDRAQKIFKSLPQALEKAQEDLKNQGIEVRRLQHQLEFLRKWHQRLETKLFP